MGMAAAVEHRYVEPLTKATEKLATAMEKGEIQDDGTAEARVQLDILTETLKNIPLH